MKKFHFTTFYCVLIFVFFISCNKIKNKHNEWNTEWMAPLMQSTLSINNIVADTLLHTANNHSLDLVYQNTIYDLNFAEQTLRIPDTTFSSPFSLSGVGLPQKTIENYMSLGKMATMLPPAYALLIYLSNGGVATIPAIHNNSTTYSAFDASNLFDYAYVTGGGYEVNGENYLPIPIDTMIFAFRNVGDINPIDTMWVTNIPANYPISATPAHFSRVKKIPIGVNGNTKLTGKLEASLLYLSSSGSNGNTVPIDTSKGLHFEFVLHNVTADSARAKFPNQYLVDSSQLVTYNYVPGHAQVNKVKIKSGQIRVQVFSIIADTLKFIFKMPPLVSPIGVAINEVAVVPPFQNNGYSSVTVIKDISGYDLDLRGPHLNMHNTFYDTIRVKIDSTGKFSTITKKDSVFALYSLENIVPEYAEGYLGDTSINISINSTAFDLFNRIKGGTFSPEKLKVSMNIENRIGVDGKLILNNLTAHNTNTHQSVSLQAPRLLNNDISIHRATQMPVHSTFTEVSVNEANSNIKSLMQLLPNTFSMIANVQINPNGNVSNYHDFVYYDSHLKVNMGVAMPLSLIANNLTLKDTLAFSVATNSSQLNSIKDGTLTLWMDNGFPLSANISVDIVDVNYKVIDHLINNFLMPAAPLDNNCRAIGTQQSRVDITMTQERMNNLKNGAKAIIKAAFSTSSQSICNGQYLKIYDNYQLQTKLTGKFTYHLSAF